MIQLDRNICPHDHLCPLIKICPVGAISRTDYVAPGKKLPARIVDQEKCIKCGMCIASCKFKAIEKK